MDCVSILCVFITAGHIIILVCLFFFDSSCADNQT